MADRVTSAGLISCLGAVESGGATREMPLATKLTLAAARHAPWLARPMVALTARQALKGKLVPQLAKSMAAPDAEVLTRPDVREALGLSLAETFRQGNGPAFWDGVVVARGSGFRLEDIRVPVLIWHGEADRNDPVWMAREQEARLPNVQATYYKDEGHLIFSSRANEILPALA